jgi:hypothetical protein
MLSRLVAVRVERAKRGWWRRCPTSFAQYGQKGTDRAIWCMRRIGEFGCWHSLTTRYDLNALFKKQFGYMTVNVQGLSRVCILYARPDIQLTSIAGHVLAFCSVLWQVCQGQLCASDWYHSCKSARAARRGAHRYRGMRSSDGSQVGGFSYSGGNGASS